MNPPVRNMQAGAGLVQVAQPQQKWHQVWISGLCLMPDLLCHCSCPCRMLLLLLLLHVHVHRKKLMFQGQEHPDLSRAALQQQQLQLSH